MVEQTLSEIEKSLNGFNLAVNYVIRFNGRKKKLNH